MIIPHQLHAVTSWTQVGPIIGDPGQQYVANTADHIGFSVSISSDGSRIANGGISSLSGGAGNAILNGNPRLFLELQLDGSNWGRPIFWL